MLRREKKLAAKLLADRDGPNVVKHIKALNELIGLTNADEHMKEKDKSDLVAKYEKTIGRLKLKKAA
jgi:hypothetical protein